MNYTLFIPLFTLSLLLGMLLCLKSADGLACDGGHKPLMGRFRGMGP